MAEAADHVRVPCHLHLPLPLKYYELNGNCSRSSSWGFPTPPLLPGPEDSTAAIQQPEETEICSAGPEPIPIRKSTDRLSSVLAPESPLLLAALNVFD